MSDIQEEIKEILDDFTKYKDDWYSVKYILKPKQCVALYDYITNLQKENKKLKELCDKYEEEHKTTFIEWQKDINILKEIKQWLEVNDRYSQGYFKQVLEYINILKGSDKE